MAALPKRLLVLVFSKDRALQLDGTLRTLQRHCRGLALAQEVVLYKTSDADHERQYQRLQSEHPRVQFLPETHFEGQVLNLLQGHEHVLFSVDDTLFVSGFCLQQVMDGLAADPGVAGFTLRLGRNTSFNYFGRFTIGLPPFVPAGEGMLKYRWSRAESPFKWALEVSSSVYRCRDLLPLLDQQPVSHPHALEKILIQRQGRLPPWLLCFEQSVAFSNPVNVVQKVARFQWGRQVRYPVDDLKRLFDEGYRLDGKQYDGFVPNSTHQEVPLHLRKVDAEPGENGH